MAHTDIDKVNGFVIRKLHSPDKSKSFGFLTVPIGYNGEDISLIGRFDTLTAARNACGFETKPAATLTAPKSAYAQCQKGFKRR